MSETELCEKSGRIIDRLRKDACYLSAERILLYLHFGSEVRTDGLLWAALRDGKSVYAPKVVSGTRMSFYELMEPVRLEIGAKGIREPVPDPDREYPENRDVYRGSLMVMPGVAFDAEKHRIGYGGGYYDRFLYGKEELVTAAVCFECQITDRIPFEEHDYLPDFLYTERGFYGK